MNLSLPLFVCSSSLHPFAPPYSFSFARYFSVSIFASLWCRSCLFLNFHHLHLCIQVPQPCSSYLFCFINISGCTSPAFSTCIWFPKHHGLVAKVLQHNLPPLTRILRQNRSTHSSLFIQEHKDSQEHSSWLACQPDLKKSSPLWLWRFCCSVQFQFTQPLSLAPSSL